MLSCFSHRFHFFAARVRLLYQSRLLRPRNSKKAREVIVVLRPFAPLDVMAQFSHLGDTFETNFYSLLQSFEAVRLSCARVDQVSREQQQLLLLHCSTRSPCRMVMQKLESTRGEYLDDGFESSCLDRDFVRSDSLFHLLPLVSGGHLGRHVVHHERNLPAVWCNRTRHGFEISTWD